jgi:probable rRNA maturation factor
VADARSVVLVTARGGPFTGVNVSTIRRRASKMLSHLGLTRVELSIALVGDARMAELNRAYRRKNRPTDVLSFPMHEPPARARRRGAKAAEIGLAWPHRGPLGDVILSVDTARRQAAERHHELIAELTMLLAHGLLHLLGYDHRTDAEEREMLGLTRDLQAAAVARERLRPRAGSRSKR